MQHVITLGDVLKVSGVVLLSLGYFWRLRDYRLLGSGWRD